MAVHRTTSRKGRVGRPKDRQPSAEKQLGEIRAGLAKPQKELPSKLFYDQRGSELFEQITGLPEYYLTRAEEALLRARVPAWVAGMRPRSLVELGAGSAAKTRVILDAMVSGETGECYVPVDISADFLADTADDLRRSYPSLRVAPVVADFTQPGALALPENLPRPALLTILGSTIGNLPTRDAVALLRRVRTAMEKGDRFLLGVDLRKDISVLEAAYNDPAGVTGEFNLNLLRVLNRRFGTDFDLDAFRHRAVYDEGEQRIEMHLVSERPQTIHVPGGGFVDLDEGESIRTEISCKYDRQTVAKMFDSAELDLVEWYEGEDRLFALALGAPAC